MCEVLIYPVHFFSFWRCSNEHPLHQLICSSPLSLLSFTPTLPLSFGWILSSLCLQSLEVILSHLLLATDSGQCGSLAAQLIITHAGPTEAMALWNTASAFTASCQGLTYTGAAGVPVSIWMVSWQKPQLFQICLTRGPQCQPLQTPVVEDDGACFPFGRVMMELQYLDVSVCLVAAQTSKKLDSEGELYYRKN